MKTTIADIELVLADATARFHVPFRDLRSTSLPEKEGAAEDECKIALVYPQGEEFKTAIYTLKEGAIIAVKD